MRGEPAVLTGNKSEPMARPDIKQSVGINLHASSVLKATSPILAFFIILQWGRNKVF